MQRIRRLYLLIFLGMLPLLVTAQSYRLQLHVVDAVSEKTNGLIKVPESFEDANSTYSFIQQIIPNLQERGYLAASIDSIAIKGLSQIFLDRAFRSKFLEYLPFS